MLLSSVVIFPPVGNLTGGNMLGNHDGDNDDDDDDDADHEENADDKCFKVYTQPTQSKEPQWIACYTLTMGRSTRTLSTTL